MKTAIKVTIQVVSVWSLLSIPSIAGAQGDVPDAGQYMRNILPMRQRVQLMESWWKEKKRVVLPQIMREQGVDLWIVRNDEADRYYNNEGPVYTSLLPANFEGMTLPSKHVAAGRQETPRIMTFYDDGDEVRFAEPRDYRHLADMVRQVDPRRIAVGSDNNEEILAALGEDYRKRVVDSWTLGVRWLETALPEQISVFRYVQGLANDLIAEGFSNKAIIPGITTTGDLNWWFRQKMLDLDVEYENHPSIRVQRSPANVEEHAGDAAVFVNGSVGNGTDITIQRGDIISIDSDIFMLGLVTDSHQHAYVLQEGESDVPEELKSALLIVNELQDRYAQEFRIGRTGKDIIAASDRIHRHDRVTESSLGFHPPPMFIRRYLLGGYMFSHKTYVAGMTSGPGYYPTSIVTNDHKLYANTLYAFEPHTSVAVAGWGEHGVELGIGQIVVVRKDGLEYLERPQVRDWHVVR